MMIVVVVCLLFACYCHYSLVKAVSAFSCTLLLLLLIFVTIVALAFLLL